MCKGMTDEGVVIDCDAGRRLGCETYCCCLLVRLDESEREMSRDGIRSKKFVEKAPNGRCVHLDRDTGRCRNWDQRPKVCRDYDCNQDDLLQIVLRDGYHSLVALVTATPPSPHVRKIEIPYVDSENS